MNPPFTFRRRAASAARLPPVYDGLPLMSHGTSPPDPFGGAGHDVGGLQPPVSPVTPLRRDFRMRGREVVNPLHRDAVGATRAGTRAQHCRGESVPRIATGAAADAQPRVGACVPADDFDIGAGICRTPYKRLVRHRPRFPRGLARCLATAFRASGVATQHRVGVAVPGIAAY